MKYALSAILIAVGLINVYPVIGLGSAAALSDLYGIATLEGDLLILMRHRALLLGILGVLLIASSYLRKLQPAAIIAGLVSMLGFVLLALADGGYGSQLNKVVIADVAGSVALAAAGLLWIMERNTRKMKGQ